MSDTRAAYRYALAVAGLAEESSALDTVARDFRIVTELAAASTEFRAFLKSPVVNTEKKKRILTEVLQGKVSELAMKFVLFLAAKGREGLLLEVIGQFDRLRDRKQGVIHATVKSVVPFTKAQEELLVRQLESATGKKLRLTYVIDASLKGGFTVQQEDTVWDASVRHQLERLHIQFMES